MKKRKENFTNFSTTPVYTKLQLLRVLIYARKLLRLGSKQSNGSSIFKIKMDLTVSILIHLFSLYLIYLLELDFIPESIYF